MMRIVRIGGLTVWSDQSVTVVVPSSTPASRSWLDALNRDTRASELHANPFGFVRSPEPLPAGPIDRYRSITFTSSTF